MEHRRLKVLGAAPASPSLPDLAPLVRLPRGCVAVSDLGSGVAAGWALTLLEEAAALGRNLPVMFTAFGRPPELDAASRARCASVASRVETFAVAPVAGAAAELWEALSPSLAAQPCWLLVGAPAVLAFDAPLSVLITQGAAPHTFPEGLRRRRAALSLELSEPRASMARELARALVRSHRG